MLKKKFSHIKGTLDFGSQTARDIAGPDHRIHHKMDMTNIAEKVEISYQNMLFKIGKTDS